MLQLFLFLGALNGLIAVAAGAYGRHGPFDDYSREMFAIGVQYQLTHALALIAVAWLASRPESCRRLTMTAGLAFALGIALFSGTLYYFGVTRTLPFAGSAPAGGFLLMAGWLCLMIEAVRGFRQGR
ncbi:MAG: DUF423 domain-containing protein [Rhodospirillales bacterium]